MEINNILSSLGISPENIDKKTKEKIIQMAENISKNTGDVQPNMIGEVMKMFGKFYRFNCRIEGVDTPELRTRNKKEKAMGIKVRDELRKKILDKMVKVECGEFDKYGRLLVDIIIDNTSIKKWLIENNYAFSYDGGTKKSWAEYLENNN